MGLGVWLCNLEKKNFNGAWWDGWDEFGHVWKQIEDLTGKVFFLERGGVLDGV